VTIRGRRHSQCRGLAADRGARRGPRNSLFVDPEVHVLTAWTRRTSYRLWLWTLPFALRARMLPLDRPVRLATSARQEGGKTRRPGIEPSNAPGHQLAPIEHVARGSARRSRRRHCFCPGMTRKTGRREKSFHDSVKAKMRREDARTAIGKDDVDHRLYSGLGPAMRCALLEILGMDLKIGPIIQQGQNGIRKVG